MENEIKVGEYIRNKYGDIDKVKYISKYDDGDIHINTMRGKIYYRPREIVKHSSNLIDLIQCGDYVNGEKVEKIAEPSLANDYNRLIYCNECEGLHKLILFNKDIKEIVTKEMMGSISYKVTKM